MTLDNIKIQFAGIGHPEPRAFPENETKYPEPDTFGTTPSWGLYARHVTGLTVRNVSVSLKSDDARSDVSLEDASGVEFDHFRVPSRPALTDGVGPAFEFKGVSGFVAQSCSDIADTGSSR